MKTDKRFSFILSLVLLFLLFHTSKSLAEDLQVIRIGTGGKTGVYYPIGKLIARGFTEQHRKNEDPDSGETGIPGCIAVAQNSAGSIENILTIISGETEAGLVQADAAFRAYTSQGAFGGEERYKSIRALASLYPEKFQIVTRKDSRIRSVADLRGKCISLDEKGSGTLSVLRIILRAHNMSERDLLPLYLKPVFTEDKMIRGDIQGFVMMAGVPMEAVVNLLDIDIALVPIQEEILSKINILHPYLVPGVIPADTYPGVPETSTLQVHALLAVNAEMDNDLIYQMTAQLWTEHMLRLLRQGHPQGEAVTLGTALDGLSIPLHDGAKRFYRELGMLEKELVFK